MRTCVWKWGVCHLLYSLAFFIFPIHSVCMSVTTWINYLSRCSLSPSASQLIAADAQGLTVHVGQPLGVTLMGGSGMRLIPASVDYLMSNWGWGSLFQKGSWGQEISLSCRWLKGGLCLPCGFLHRLLPYGGWQAQVQIIKRGEASVPLRDWIWDVTAISSPIV